jgi:hypothetical protein
MNNKDNNNNSNNNNHEHHDHHDHGCGCGMHNGMGMNRFFVLRWVLGILIIVLVFLFGMKIGEFKGTMESGYGYHGGMMRSGGMMQGGY